MYYYDFKVRYIIQSSLDLFDNSFPYRYLVSRNINHNMGENILSYRKTSNADVTSQGVSLPYCYCYCACF